MKKASSFLVFSNLFNPHRFSKAAPLLSTNYIFSSSSSSFSSSPLQSTNPRLPSSAKTHGLLVNLHGFQTNPSRNLCTLVEKPTQLSSTNSQRKQREKSDLEEAFRRAQTSEEMLRAFRDMEMEGCFDERELGIAVLKVGFQLDREGEAPEKVLSFAERALEVLDRDGKPSLLLAMALKLMRSANIRLKRFNDYLGYSERIRTLCDEIDERGGAIVTCSIDIIKFLEIKEMIIEDGKELGMTYREMAEAYVSVLKFKDGLPYGLKALEILTKELSLDSLEVAYARRILGLIYTRLEEHDKAFKQNELSQNVSKNWCLSRQWLRAETNVADEQIELGNYEEVINTLESIVQYTEEESENRALLFISMGKALCYQEKFADSKRYLEIACGILDKMETDSPVELAWNYRETSELYVKMEQFETAISLLKRTLALLEKQPEEQEQVIVLIVGLLLKIGELQQAIPYMERQAEHLKARFGSNHFELFHIYFCLGMAYSKYKPESKAEMIAAAKEIMDVSLDPQNADTIQACQQLSEAYSSMGSYSTAIEIQQRVIDAWEHHHGPRAEDELREAQRFLEDLKTEACGTSHHG